MKEKMVKSAINMMLSGCLLMTSCQKQEESETLPDQGNNQTGISPVPSSFTQKVLIEQFTGAWNGNCPDGIYRMDELISGNNRIIGVNIHMGDAMETSLFNSMIGAFNNNLLPQFPSAMINRFPSLGNIILSKTQWASNVSLHLGKAASCGLALKSKSLGNTGQVEVHAGFGKNLSGTLHLTVYLAENALTGTGQAYDQVNSNSGNDPSSPYYNLPSPIAGFKHNHVVRDVLSDDLGDPIEGTSLIPGGEFVKNYSIDLSGMNKSNLYLVAFVSRKGTANTDFEVLNVQVCPINEIKNWD